MYWVILVWVGVCYMQSGPAFLEKKFQDFQDKFLIDYSTFWF